jgi:hypothetical protein
LPVSDSSLVGPRRPGGKLVPILIDSRRMLSLLLRDMTLVLFGKQQVVEQRSPMHGRRERLGVSQQFGRRTLDAPHPGVAPWAPALLERHVVHEVGDDSSWCTIKDAIA